jgi:23S rRNA (uracil1939-C5)-methyltransferase
MLHENQQIELIIEKPVAGGRMLARREGQIVLVAGTIPGERVRARIERVGRGVAFASTLEVLDAADTRRAPDGDPLCGGNVYAHVRYDAQPDIKREVLRDALRHGGRIEWKGDLPITPSPEHSYRMRARLHVRGGRAGFFREGTHDLCDASCTRQLLPEAMQAIAAFVAGTPKPWLDAIDAIELAENIAGDQRALHVLWSPRVRPPRSMPPESWNVETLPGVSGISVDHPLSGRARTITGAQGVSDPVSQLIGSSAAPSAPTQPRPPADTADAQPLLQRHAASFFQANRYLLPTLVSAVARHVEEAAGADSNESRGGSGERGPIIDLYAGVGLFAVTLAARGHEHIIAIEGDPASAHDLKSNAAPFGARLQVEHTSVEQFLAGSSNGARTLIVDPPRTGMSREALASILALRAPRVVYVSCDVATLARDLRRMLDSGYSLTHLEAFDLFPNTAHIESLAVLSL